MAAAAAATDVSAIEPSHVGVGLGYRSPFRADVFLHRDKIDVLEIIADHYFDATAEKLDELELLAAHFPLLPHGLDLSLGSAEGIDEAYLDKFATLIERVKPEWWSEHIAFTRAGGVSIGHLACLPYTHEAIETMARNVERVRRVIATPLILENVTVSVLPPGGQMDEPEFVSRVLEATNCGWLCDVTNIHTNAVNQKRDLDAELDSWPWRRATQAHIAGGHFAPDGELIDSHDAPAPPEAWRLLRVLAERGSLRGAIIERDENLPPFSELLGELDLARAAVRTRR